MKAIAGFIVAEVPPEIGGWNPNYRGVDRLVAWSMEEMQGGFEDPLVFVKNRDVASEEGLVETLDDARFVLRRFEQIRPREKLELLYVRAVPNGVSPSRMPPLGFDTKWLGFDVACDSPFYSILGDLPVSPLEAPEDVRRFQGSLNENGLLPAALLAKSYLDIFQRTWPEATDGVTYRIWEVFRVLDV